MKARNLLFVSLAVLGVVALPATAAHALLVKVSVNFGPTLVGPDNGTLIVAANPGDLLRITWALGTDTDIDIYRGLVSGGGHHRAPPRRCLGPRAHRSGLRPRRQPERARSWGVPLYRVVGRGSDRLAGNGGELWRIDYLVPNPVTDVATDISYSFDDSYQCTTLTWRSALSRNVRHVMHRYALTPFPSRPRFSCSGWV